MVRWIKQRRCRQLVARSVVVLVGGAGASIASSAWSQSLLVFQMGRPHVSGATDFSWARGLFDTRGLGSVDSYSLTNSLQGGWAGSGYVWRPWFSTLSGGLSLNASHNVGAGGQESSSWAGEGRVNLELVPKSHIPFRGALSYSLDDDQNAQLKADLHQQIRPFNPLLPDFNIRYAHSRRDRPRSSSGSDSLGLGMSGSLEKHSYSANMQAQRNGARSESLDSHTESYNFTLNHSLPWSKTLSVSEFFSVYDSKTRTETVGPAIIGGRTAVFAEGVQGNMVATWSPKGAWSANAAVTARTDRSGVDGPEESVDFRVDQFTGSLSTTYRPRGDVRVSWSADLRRRVDEEQEEDQFSHNLAAFYSPESIDRGEWRYAWDLSGDYGYRWADAGSSERARVAAGQRVSRRWQADRSSWQLTASQDVSKQLIAEQSEPLELNQRASLSWRGNKETYSDYVSVSLSDSRSLFEGRSASVQLLSFLFNRGGRVGRFGDWDVGLNYQVEREEQSDGAVDFDDSGSSRGQINMSYARSNFWGVFNLQYRTELLSNLNYDKEDDTVERESSWDNDLAWQLGRLSAGVNVKFRETDDGANGSISFKVRRRWSSH